MLFYSCYFIKYLVCFLLIFQRCILLPHLQHRDLLVGGAVDILIGLVEALLFMHAHGFFHCGLSSHAIHLVALSNAKLGGFEYAFESKVKVGD